MLFMDWLRDRWSLFWEAYRRQPGPYTIAVLGCGLLFTSDYLKQIISRWIDFPEVGSVFLGMPVPLLGILLFVLVLFWVMLQHASELKKAVTPTIDVSFNPKAEGIILTPIHVAQQRGDAVEVMEDQSVYVSVTANVISKTTVKNCVGFITKIEKKTTEAFEDIPVYGYIKLGEPGDGYPRVPMVINFVRTSKASGTLDLGMSRPLLN
jgi:hypothetical protein